jgi:hypothetical protein
LISNRNWLILFRLAKMIDFFAKSYASTSPDPCVVLAIVLAAPAGPFPEVSVRQVQSPAGGKGASRDLAAASLVHEKSMLEASGGPFEIASAVRSVGR